MARLLVPIQLDALVVRTPGTHWALTRLDTPRPATKVNRRQQLVPDPFQELPGGRPPGVYLHWALPDGLTHASTNPDGSQHFPAVPDSWLVVRLSGSNRFGPRNVRAWLIPDVNAQTPTVLDPLSGAPLPASGPAPAQLLTAAGPGDLAWAAYYDNVEGRLALHDDLVGVDPGPISYLVAGWYRNPANDPAHAVSAADSAAKLAGLGWSYPAGQLPVNGFPDGCLLHGYAVAIGWPDQHWPGDGGTLGTEADLRPDPTKITASIGETVAEALATLTAPGAGGAQTRLMEGLLASSLQELNRPDGPAQLDTALHATRFGARAAPHLDEWIWAPAMPGATPASAASAPQAAGLAGPAADPTFAGEGDAAEALTASQAAAGITPDAGDDVSGFRKVLTSQPRLWHALDPEIVLSGAGRSVKHGGDGRYSADGTLGCRIEGNTVIAFGVPNWDQGIGAAVLPGAALGNYPAYGIPAGCPALLVELACLDPGSAADLATATATAPSPVAAARARWWTARDPNVPPSQALTGSTVIGTMPSPLAVTPPSLPWIPVHLEWSAGYRPSPRGLHDWQLTELDFELPANPSIAEVDPGYPLRGRVMLSSAPAQVAAAAAGVVNQQAGRLADGSSQLTAAADLAGGQLTASLAGSDLLSGALTGIMGTLRGDPDDPVVHPTNAPAAEPDPGPRPPFFRALRAGFMELNRLRLVDGFGQYVDLLPGPLTLLPAPDLQVPYFPTLLSLKPRFTAEARVLLRYAAASGDHVDASSAVSPVCGFVVPSPLDGTLEFFDEDGTRIGRLRPDDVSGTAWEDDPGTRPVLGARPSSRIPNPFLGGFADGLLNADVAAANAAGGAPRTTALEAFVRIIDATRWSTDDTGRAGDEHLALLLGRPVAVLRANIMLDVQDPRKAPEITTTAVPVKLGTLAHQQDGLLAYLVGDDPSQVRVVDPVIADADAAVAAAAASGFVDASDVFTIQPGIPVPLTMFVVPQTDVHATVGLLPQKAVGMLREWTAPGLSRLSPAFRYGPILRDPQATRLPVPSDVRGNWTWHRRADQTSWAADGVVPSTQDALFSQSPVVASEGWLSVTLLPDTSYTSTAQQVRIGYIRSRTYRNKGKQVLAVGGLNSDGSHFLIPVQQAARLQETGRFAFYVQQDPSWPRRDIHVITRRDGVKYLRTTNDKILANNLVALPEAPADW